MCEKCRENAKNSRRETDDSDDEKSRSRSKHAGYETSNSDARVPTQAEIDGERPFHGR